MRIQINVCQRYNKINKFYYVLALGGRMPGVNQKVVFQSKILKQLAFTDIAKGKFEYIYLQKFCSSNNFHIVIEKLF